MDKILENINELKNHINVVYNTYNNDIFKCAHLYEKDLDDFPHHIRYHRNIFYHPKMIKAIRYMGEGNEDLLVSEGYDEDNEYGEDSETLACFIFAETKSMYSYFKNFNNNNNNRIIYYIIEEIIKLVREIIIELFKKLYPNCRLYFTDIIV